MNPENNQQGLENNSTEVIVSLNENERKTANALANSKAVQLAAATALAAIIASSIASNAEASSGISGAIHQTTSKEDQPSSESTGSGSEMEQVNDGIQFYGEVEQSAINLDESIEENNQKMRQVILEQYKYTGGDPMAFKTWASADGAMVYIQETQKNNEEGSTKTPVTHQDLNDLEDSNTGLNILQQSMNTEIESARKLVEIVTDGDVKEQLKKVIDDVLSSHNLNINEFNRSAVRYNEWIKTASISEKQEVARRLGVSKLPEEIKQLEIVPAIAYEDEN